MQRLHTESLDEITWHVEEYSLPDNIAGMVIVEKPSLDDLNQFAAILKDMGEREVTALSENWQLSQKSPRQSSLKPYPAVCISN